MSENKNLWVLVETKEDGSAVNVGLELLNPGRRMADTLGGKLVAVIIGAEVSKAKEEVKDHGVDAIITCEGEIYKEYNTDVYANAVCKLVENHNPNTILIGATNQGRDLGPRVSSRLHTGLTADCTELDVDAETGNVQWTRPAFGGNLMATIVCENFRPQMATVRPGVMQALDNDTSRKGEVEEFKVDFTDADMNVKILDIAKEESHKKDITEAKILVSGGRGIGGPEGFKPLQELADKLEAEISASRASVDSGWITKDHQVGQTGKTVRPELYFAMGISGAIQHVAGMEDSDLIIAVNKDPEAAIFEVADLGVVGDINAVVPKLIEAIEREQRIKAEI